MIFVRINVAHGAAEDKPLMTGLHTVRDIYCKICLTVVGWTYVSLEIKLHSDLRNSEYKKSNLY